MIRVFVVDDQALVRSGLTSLLALADGIEVVGEAGDGAAALEAIAAVDPPPDVVLTDVRMPGMDGLELLRRLVPEGRRVIVLTTFPDDVALLEALKAGAAGYLLKDATFEELVDAIRSVARGESAVRPVTVSRILPGLERVEVGGAPAPDVALTAREKEVLRLLASGMSNKEIAAALDNAEGTVKNHVSNILSKLGVRDRTQAVLLGIQLGLF